MSVRRWGTENHMNVTGFAFVNTNLKNNPYFCGLQVNKASWKLSLRSHWERVKTETCFASGENQRKAHTLAVNNDQQHEPNSLCIARATVPPGDRSAELQPGKNVRGKEREREWVSGRCAREMSVESSLEKGLRLFMLAKWPTASCSSVQTS